MSTDWNKYARPEETLLRGSQLPENYEVIELDVGQVRKLPEQSVVHTPNVASRNRAHTDVFGEKTTEVRAKFMKIYKR